MRRIITLVRAWLRGVITRQELLTELVCDADLANRLVLARMLRRIIRVT